jgi:alanine racemase
VKPALNNWIELSAERLTANLRVIQTVAGLDTTVLAVIKANAYGHGAEDCAPILVRAGATWLGVTCASEGARVRLALAAAGLTAEILIMSGFLPADVAAIHQHSLTPVVWSQEHVAWLAGYPATRVHLEVDTGMGRQGVTPGPELDALLAELAAAGLVADGIFTHFCSSEVAGSPLTHLQQQRFAGVVAQVQAAGLCPTYLHAANSSALDNPEAAAWLARLASRLGAHPMVRTGLSLYGYALPIEGAVTARLRPLLQPVLTWKAHVLSVRSLAAGDTVGYNAIFTAEREMRVALLPVGYADGLRRELSATNAKPGGWVMLHGVRAAILGRISMNLTVVDVTDIPSVQAGDEAIVLGDGITADDHAALARTISYEILCGIHPCV